MAGYLLDGGTEICLHLGLDLVGGLDAVRGKVRGILQGGACNLLQRCGSKEGLGEREAM